MVVVMGAVEADLTAAVVASMEAAEAPSLTEAVAARRVLPAGRTDGPVDMADTVGMVRAASRDTAAGRAVRAERERERPLQRALASAVRQRIAAA
jgi:hypothetical protein